VNVEKSLLAFDQSMKDRFHRFMFSESHQHLIVS